MEAPHQARSGRLTPKPLAVGISCYGCRGDVMNAPFTRTLALGPKPLVSPLRVSWKRHEGKLGTGCVPLTRSVNPGAAERQGITVRWWLLRLQHPQEGS